MQRWLLISIVIVATACNVSPNATVPVSAADDLSRRYEKQQLQAYAAGKDCLILLIESKAELNDSAVEAIQYGTGPYTGYPGGTQQFAEDHGFSAVVFRDSRQQSWRYGSITRDQARSLTRCH
jgi:hypothetical protein